MKKYTNYIIVSVFLAALFISTHASALVITGAGSAQDLAQTLVGGGVTISNVTYTGATAASGYFTGGVASGLGFDQGIVLTSGAAANFNGSSNTDDGAGTSNNLAGDADLNTLIPGTTLDATVLEFDFVSTGDSAYFNYIFGSEEYNEYVNSSFNDVFGFFFEGNNVALIPGTTTAVSINNVNNGLNSAYYNDNDPGPYATELDGFTSAFTAEIEGLTAGNTYHIKLAIADAGDTILDSAVFLQAGSFSETPVPTAPVPEPATMFLLGSGLIGFASRKKIFKKK